MATVGRVRPRVSAVIGAARAANDPAWRFGDGGPGRQRPLVVRCGEQWQWRPLAASTADRNAFGLALTDKNRACGVRRVGVAQIAPLSSKTGWRVGRRELVNHLKQLEEGNGVRSTPCLRPEHTTTGTGGWGGARAGSRATVGLSWLRGKEKPAGKGWADGLNGDDRGEKCGRSEVGVG